MTVNGIHRHTYIYIYMLPPPLMYPRFVLESCAISETGQKLQGIQTDSGRIQLNTPPIQDSRFKVQGKLLPGTLNLES